MVVAANALISVTPGLMIWTIVCFLLALFVLKRYAFGPIQNMIDERRRVIREALDEADHAREEARNLLEEHRKLVASARHDAEDILVEARRISDSMRERVKEETEAERQRRLEEVRKQIESETQRALDAIRREVAVLTLEATAKVTGKVLDKDDHKRLIEDAIKELDFTALEGSNN
jgi:F-type H+-transporting ATPase subunit b